MFGDDRPGIVGVWYGNAPEEGWGVGFTYGASLCGQSNVELMVQVQSLDPRWIWAMADFVDRHRDSIGHIAAGDTINWGEPVSAASPMDAFVITRAVVLADGDDIVHLSDNDHVQILQAVPAYAEELPVVRQAGVAAWAKHINGNPMDPCRPRLRGAP